jgi:hypothetical protein
MAAAEKERAAVLEKKLASLEKAKQRPKRKTELKPVR